MNLFLQIPPQWILSAATLGSIGFLGRAPGTNGSFFGLIWYTLFFHKLGLILYLFFGIFSAAIACKICTQAEILLQKKDPSCIILDEMVAMPFCFVGLQPYMQYYPVVWFMFAGFLLFRLFDILKPFGIKNLQALPGGKGIVMDDIAAACVTCLCLHFVAFFL